MMQVAAYGRMGQEPRSIPTRSGKTMVTTSIAVNIEDADAPPLWLGVVAFGAVAELLLKHDKGDLISVSGRCQRNSWTTNTGEKREQLQIVADSIVSSRTVRPGGARKMNEKNISVGRNANDDRRAHDLGQEAIPF